MRRMLQRIAPVLHLTRVTTAFAVVANTWFIVLWCRAAAPEESVTPELEQRPLWMLLLGGAFLALGLFAFGTTLNDILDLRRDRTFRPDRPLPAGRISLEAAIALVVCTMIASVLGATIFGQEAVLLTLLLLAAIMAYNAAAKFIPAIGLVLLGLIYAGHMAAPNLHIRFVWPVWMAMTHSLAVAAVTYWMAGKVPKISRRAAFAAVAGWVFWSSVMFYFQWRRADGLLWPSWVPKTAAIWPLALALLFVIVAWGKVRRYGRGPRSAEKVARYGSLWLALYACAWLVGAGHRGPAMVLLGLTAAGFLGMTVLREVYGLVEQPMGYRR